MAFFTKATRDNPFLYVAQQLATDTGWCAYVLPKDSQYNQPGIELDQSFNDSDLAGTYLFSFQNINLTADALVSAVHTYIDKSIAPNRGILWVTDATDPGAVQFSGLGFSQGSAPLVSNALTGQVSETLLLKIPNGCNVSFDAGTPAIRIKGDTATAPPISLNTIEGIAKTEVYPNEVALFFSGAGRGCIDFDLFIRQGSDFDIFDFGLKYFFRDSQGKVRIQRYPILRTNEETANDRVGFRVWIDLTNLENSEKKLRSFFAFSGKNKDSAQTVLPATFVTIFGHKINLVPRVNLGLRSDLPGDGSAMMVLQENPRQGQNRYLAPEGEFSLTLAGSSQDCGSGGCRLLCGMDGTEFIGFTPGDRLRFTPQNSAFTPQFPFDQASPVGPPIEPDAPRLRATYTTSWATVVKESANKSDPLYVAQPKGSTLFGRHDGLINDKYPALLGHKDPAYVLPTGTNFGFPLVPYAGIDLNSDVNSFSRDQIETFERQVIGATRRSVIGAPQTKMVLSARSAFFEAGPSDSQENVTTPSGVLATLETSGGRTGWSKILLGQIKGNKTQKFYFENPDPQLVQAFQTNQLFLVAANSSHLGELVSQKGPLSSEANGAGSAKFYNDLEIGGWRLAADVGHTNLYNDYRNVLIVKGCKGKLYDPPPHTADEPEQDRVSLVANPDKWTQRADFASPTTRPAPGEKLQPPDPGQQVILSQWLQDFFKDVRDRASQSEDKRYFEKLDSIARAENWTGILILRMTIQDTPNDLSGIIGGITDIAAFSAHHLAIQISQVTNTDPTQPIDIKDSSSMFGLIYYNDRDYDPAHPGQPVPPTTGIDYDFRLLTLKVLFENTAIKDFQSYAQVTLNKLLAMPVSRMGAGGNAYNTIVLTGSYQNDNGKALYSLRSVDDSTFYFENNVLGKIEIITAQMSTRDAGASGTVVSWFGFSGFLDFKTVFRTVVDEDGQEESLPFDVFSFGTEGNDAPRQGLSFSNLGLQMSFPKADPATRQFTPSISEIRFDVGTSTARTGSLFINFALELQGLQSGSADSPPSQGGALPALTDARLTGVDGSDWYALRYQLNLGSPGALAGKVGLSAYLLTAWSPNSSGEDSYEAMVGLELPGTGGGAKLISLQTVLKLSIGQLRLTRDEAKQSFLLMLTEIALKFLGLLKIPPSGSTLFYLFGNPKSDGKASGLGWYALYRKKEDARPLQPVSLLQEVTKNV